MNKKINLKEFTNTHTVTSPHGVIKLLLADHKLLKSLMKQVKSQKATQAEKIKYFKELEKTVHSHVKAEENSFFKLIKDNPKFQDMVFEGYEEHRVHETIFAGIHRVSDKDRRVQQMEIYCEMLEHHLKEEEKDLFPRFIKYSAQSTRRKIGKKFLEVRKESNTTKKNRGASRFSETKQI
ncbi:MAG: hemerythrin domain-containing protein [Bdellovibrionaceae bacterium]|nr:hemerythrin domain-containing protein [Pseudobdellovibrionaceae bacterium]